jgi:hypothetical protein
MMSSSKPIRVGGSVNADLGELCRDFAQQV